MFSVGIGIREGRLPREKKARQLGILLRGLLLNLLLVPAVALLLVRSLRLSGDVGLALLLVAASPGGRFAPHLTRIAGGEVGLAVQQTAILTRVSALTAPLTMTWLLGTHHLRVEVLPLIVKGLLLQTLPLEAGRALASSRADLADRLERPLRIAVVTVALFTLLAFLAESGLSSLELLGDRGWLAVIILAAGTLALGGLLGGSAAGVRRALAVGVISRNLALALLLAGHAFPARKVRLAVFGVWWLLLGAGYLFAVTTSWYAAQRRSGPDTC
jgi:BASS family bile acid:Na+ symporter